MTLSEILNDFPNTDIEALSQRVKSEAAECGHGSNSDELPYDDWELLNDIAETILQSNLPNEQRITLFFEYYEKFPSYNALTELFRWYQDSPDLPDPLRAQIWRQLGLYLGATDCYSQPVGYVLWVDLFEDQRTVRETWRWIVPHCDSNSAIQRLLLSCGPVPFELKEELYMQLLSKSEFNDAILNSLYRSARDVYGQLDRENAIRILNKMDVDRESPVFKAVWNEIMNEPDDTANDTPT